MSTNFTNINNAQQSTGRTVGFSNAGGSAVMPTSQIEMTLSCRNLLNLDVLSKSDPFCIVQMKESWQDNFFEIGRTEKINDNLNPEWVKKLIINYNFETVQKIRFEVWDVDPDGKDFLGEFETTLADIVASSNGRQYAGKLRQHSGSTHGEILIVTEEVSACKQLIEMKFRAIHLEKMCWILRNDPFLVISRSNEDGSHSVVYKSEVRNSTQNPLWKTIKIKARTLCNGDYDRSIKFDCYDKRSNGDDKLIGSSHTSLRILSKGACDDNKNILSNAKKSTDNSVGTLELISIKITEEISFLDYIQSGTQMHFAVAIDFTASNGAPVDPNSLHYLDPHRPNCYEIALRSVGEIIQHYDTSQMYPAFGNLVFIISIFSLYLFIYFFHFRLLGFGAKVPPTFEVSHQFPLNGNPSHPYCSNISDILTHYRSSLSACQLYGPTNFSPVINNTIAIARQFQDGKHYFVLLIITDGIISDMQQTKQAIISASTLPISIIIVGVGNADFDAMDELDSDDCRLNIGGRYADRDIVQFVPLNQFLAQNSSHIRSQADLARAVLAEIPDQMTGFMKSKGFKPSNLKGPATDPAIPAPTAPLS